MNVQNKRQEVVNRVPKNTDEDAGMTANSRSVEQAVLEILGLFLGKASCDINPDGQLSGLGLNSLVAVRLAYRLNQRYGLEIIPAVLYGNSTPRQLAGYISRHAVVVG